MKNLIQNLYLRTRIFKSGGGLIALFAFGFVSKFIFIVAIVASLILISLIVTDIILLFRKEVSVTCKRKTPLILSLSDNNNIELTVENFSGLKLNIDVTEELPKQFQERDFSLFLTLKPGEKSRHQYALKPLSRGEYHFGKSITYISTFLGLIERRIENNNEAMVPVYPSIIQMKQMELRAFSKISMFQGIRKLRKIGHSYEFEQIRNYVTGDDYRSINWKATGRRGAMMVNQYEDEKAQQVYFLLDKARVMRSTFGGLSLLDYSINTTLSMANITLRKEDKAGFISFSTGIDSFVKADRTPVQLRKILNKLYAEKENKLESNYEMLYTAIRKEIPIRSLLILFTNFESSYALDRVLPVLRRLSRQHLLLVIFFENHELTSFSKETSYSLKEIYYRMVAEKTIDEQEQLVNQLHLYGIQAIRTTPETLTVNVINKYLEFKSRGMI